MSKRFTKKALPLFFALVALIQFSFAKSMLKSFFSCLFSEKSNSVSCQPSTGKTILDLPDDCLYEVFKFLDWKNLFDLRLISGDFKNVFERVIDNYPCFSVYIHEMGCLCFLHYLLKYGQDFDFTVGLHNEKSVKKFVEGPFLSKVSGKKFRIRIRLNEKNYVEFLAPQLKKLQKRLRINKNSLTNLQINFDKLPLEESIVVLEAEPNNGDMITVFKKKSISFDEFEMFGSGADFFEIVGSKNSKFELSKNIKHLTIQNCPNFRFITFKEPKTKSLCVFYQDGFKGDESRGMLEELTIDSCNLFTGKGLKPGIFQDLTVVNCINFDIKLRKGPKSLGSLKLWGCNRK